MTNIAAVWEDRDAVRTSFLRFFDDEDETEEIRIDVKAMAEPSARLH